MCKELNSSQLKQIQEESRLCYYQSITFSKYYELKELSEEDSGKYKEKISSTDINTLQDLVRNIENDINNINKTMKTYSSIPIDRSTIITTESSSNEDEEILKNKVEDKLYLYILCINRKHIFELNIENTELINILKNINNDVENNKLSTIELEEIYKKCEEIFSELSKRVYIYIYMMIII